MDDLSLTESFPEQTSKRSGKMQMFPMSYDHFAKWLFSRAFVARTFFEHFLPTNILEKINLDTLELISPNFINSNGKESIGDVLYQAELKEGGRKSFVILLEHKSRTDRGVALQMARYNLDLLDNMFQNPEQYANAEGKIPSPYPILFCQESCPNFDEIVARLYENDRYGVSFEYQSVNVNEIDLESLRNIACLFASFSLFRLSKDPIRKNWEELKEKLSEPFEVMIADYLDSEKQERYRGILTGLLSFSSFFIRSEAKTMEFINDLKQKEIKKYQGNEERLESMEALLEEEMVGPFQRIDTLTHSLTEMGKMLSQKDELLSQTRQEISQKDRQLTLKDKQLTLKDEALSLMEKELSQTRESIGDTIASSLQNSIVTILQGRFPEQPLALSARQNLLKIKAQDSLEKILLRAATDPLPVIEARIGLVYDGL